MSAESPDNRTKDYRIPSQPMELAEMEWSAEGAPAVPPPVEGLATASLTMLAAAEIDFAEAALAGPAVALRLTARIAPASEVRGCQREFVGLLHALDDFGRTLGGRGLTLDTARSAATNEMLTAVLRPLEVRWWVSALRTAGSTLIFARIYSE